ncbi:hypothetical protein M529_20645 [Sphingobium ummariense RL-3]|uniref:Transposase n=1 Tax=Sphingobium ummariense RL-3 TaxID=1346791 RepID=T0IN83_9SPHN|nr:hypothetical protein [Sphingobium ummariense]EQB30280.1 hypothetical protein M529_20645 [Sphingobium ummariense RL-3]
MLKRGRLHTGDNAQIDADGGPRIVDRLKDGHVKAIDGTVTAHMSKHPASPFRYFNSSPEVIRLVVLMYARYPLSLWNVEDLFFERGIDICRETVRLWWNRFGPLFASNVRRQRISRIRGFRHWR